jgi:hypothetical protein
MMFKASSLGWTHQSSTRARSPVHSGRGIGNHGSSGFGGDASTSATSAMEQVPASSSLELEPEPEPEPEQSEPTSPSLHQVDVLAPGVAHTMSGDWLATGHSYHEDGLSREREAFTLRVLPSGCVEGWPTDHDHHQPFEITGVVHDTTLHMTQWYSNTNSVTQWTAKIQSAGTVLDGGTWSGSCAGDFHAERCGVVCSPTNSDSDSDSDAGMVSPHERLTTWWI